MYTFSQDTLLNWLTAFCIFEIPLANFYLAISKETDTVTDWYSSKTINIWNVIAQDMLYVICGIVITYRIFNYLVDQGRLSKSFLNLVFVFIGVQLTGDLLFATIIRNWPESKSTKWINYFKNYISKSGFSALFGDTLFIIAWSAAFYFVSTQIQSFDIKVFIICLFFFLVSAYSVQ
tara:strand:+ start:5087 stop:5617 length:531 start_codon:yes stop_codon:yes gene_type:complete